MGSDGVEQFKWHVRRTADHLVAKLLWYCYQRP